VLFSFPVRAPIMEHQRHPRAIPTSAADFQSRHPGWLTTKLGPVYAAALLGYSLLVSAVTGTAWYSMIVFYEAFMVAFWIWHYQAHHRIAWVPWNAACRAYHKVHHWADFPPAAFYGSDGYWRQKDTDARAKVVSIWGSLPLASSPAHEALLYAFLVAILVIARGALGVTAGTLVGALLLALVVGVVGNYLHMSFHDRDHWLQAYEVWRELRIVHFLHHDGAANQNFSMANFALDWVLGSYQGAVRDHSEVEAKGPTKLQAKAEATKAE